LRSNLAGDDKQFPSKSQGVWGKMGLNEEIDSKVRRVFIGCGKVVSAL
jgi:hypothetical protein